VFLLALRIVETAAPGRLTATVIGRGVEQWRAEATGLPVRFEGEVVDEGLAQAYAEADIVAVPSTGGESFGLVPLEAMAHHRPVIASGIAGYAAWMEGAARLVPPSDEAALAEAMKALAASPALRANLSARGAQLARQHSWDAVVDRWLALYERRRERRA
jgi:glycosyltransferase involved in cell wall biosynthesis